jgi:hypothetical protein
MEGLEPATTRVYTRGIEPVPRFFVCIYPTLVEDLLAQCSKKCGLRQASELARVRGERDVKFESNPQPQELSLS